MAAKSTETKVYQIPSQYFIDEIRSTQFSGKLNVELKSENPTDTGVWYRFHHGMTMASWGEKITITVTPLGMDKTQVAILSECGMPTQIVDFGKNRSIVCNLFEHLEKYVPQRVSGELAESPVITESAPSVTAPAGRVCEACGNALAPDAKFCSSCGKKIEPPKKKFCSSCGKEVGLAAAFCSNCGNKLQ